MDEATAAMRDTNWPWYRLLGFSLFWFGISVVSAGLLVIVLPSQVLAAFPEGSEGHDNIGSMLAGLVGTGYVMRCSAPCRCVRVRPPVRTRNSRRDASNHTRRALRTAH